MKLRLRSSESKETLKIEAPNSSSLLDLKQILSQSLPNSPSPASIRLSLNRKDELQSEPGHSLQSLGVTGGDLIFYSLDHQPGLSLQNSLPMKLDAAPDSVLRNPECSSSSKIEETAVDVESSNSGSSDAQRMKEEASGYMEVDGEDANLEISDEADELLADSIDDKSLSVPGFLRKVFVEELGNDSGNDHKLIVIAVHAVLLESGFVGFNSNTVIHGFSYQGEWPRMFSPTLHYTLPEIATGEAIQTVVLKFQSLGKFMNVYGSLSGGGLGKSSTLSVVLNEDQLVPLLNVVWANCGVEDSVSMGDGVGVSVGKEVFEFWRTVKDKIALPLLIDICEKAGLNLPPCFMCLPTDLKLKIMELSSGVEIAKLSCGCSELRYLASNDELWKLKYEEEFGKNVKEKQESWKKSFVRSWEMRRYVNRRHTTRRQGSYLDERRGIRYGGMRPFQFPGVIGGDYDRFPALGFSRYPRIGDNINRFRGNFSPQCHLDDLADEI